MMCNRREIEHIFGFNEIFSQIRELRRENWTCVCVWDGKNTPQQRWKVRHTSWSALLLWWPWLGPVRNRRHLSGPHTLHVSSFHTHTGPGSPQQSASDQVKFKNIKLKPWISHSVVCPSVAAAKAMFRKRTYCLFQLLWEESKSPSLCSCGVGSLVCHPSKSEFKSGRVIQLSTQTWKFLTEKPQTSFDILHY